MCYKSDLEKRQQQIKRQISSLEPTVYAAQTLNENWFKDYAKLNHLRGDLKAVKSRLKYHKKPTVGIPVIKVNSNQLNIS